MIRHLGSRRSPEADSILRPLTFVSLIAATPAFAGSVAQPGSTVGLPVGALRPEGVYLEDTSSYGQRAASPTGINVNLTQIVWSTPFAPPGYRLQFFAMQPTIVRASATATDVYPNSTLFATRLSKALGAGFNISYQAGFRAAQPGTFAFRQNSLDQRAALTYNADGYNLTANVLNGIFFTDGGPALHPNWLNLDLTATKKFGKLEVGPVAFASTDISSPTPTYRREGQIGVGGLVGYDFGSFNLQVFATRDVATRGYAGPETRAWTRLIIPLYRPAAASEPLRRSF